MARARSHINVLEENMTLAMERATANSLSSACFTCKRGWRRADSLDEMLNPLSSLGAQALVWREATCAVSDRWRLGAFQIHPPIWR